MRAALRRIPALLLLLAPAALLAEGQAPAILTADLESSAAGGTELHGNGLGARSGSSENAAVSALYRMALAPGGWYVEAGPEAGCVSFGSGSTLLPSALRSLDAEVSLEYFLGGEEVAALTVHPGWYYQDRMTGDSFDLPLDFYSGVPVSTSFNGVLGVSNARFYHHAIPIAGFQWDPTPELRLIGAFPNPSAVLTLGGGWSARLEGSLDGGGYRTAADAVVEYWTYRVGAGAGWKTRGMELKVSFGDEVERGFDFFKHGPDLHGGGAAYASLSLVLSR